jgi:dynactin 1
VAGLALRLQSSAAKAQARAVELELRALDAREAHALLGIVQPYLPAAYGEGDADAAAAYLFFERVGTKAALVHAVVGNAHGLPDALSIGPVSDVLVGVCEVLTTCAAPRRAALTAPAAP